MAFRTHYGEKLQNVRSSIITMGGHANEMVRMAVEATLNGNVELSNKVVLADDHVDHLERQTLNETVLVVMQEAPVATDLRMLVATIGIIGEIEKVGDDAVKLARRATKLSGFFPFELKVDLMEMGELVRHSFAAAIRCYSDYSDEIAQEIIDGDKVIDQKYSDARNKVFELIKETPENTKQLVRAIEAFHALEHVADHAVAIAVRLKMHYASSTPVDSTAS